MQDPPNVQLLGDYKIRLRFEAYTLDSMFAQPSSYMYDQPLNLKYVEEFRLDKGLFYVVHSLSKRESCFKPYQGTPAAQYLYDTCQKLWLKCRQGAALEDKDVEPFIIIKDSC